MNDPSTKALEDLCGKDALVKLFCPSLILLSLKWLWVAICSNLSCCVHGVLDLPLMEQQAFLPDITIIEFQSQHFF